MNKQIIEHLFEFWEQIGTYGGFHTKKQGYTFTNPTLDSWPSKVFNLDADVLDIQGLKQSIRSRTIPNSIGIHQSNTMKNNLLSHGFRSTSQVKSMALDTTNISFGLIDASDFIPVMSQKEAGLFAQIASKSFGYPVAPSTIEVLIDKPEFRLFLGKLGDAFPSCGMVYIDKNGVAGIHMIGTMETYRGMGIGKKMTQFLIHQTQKAPSKQVFLVASQAGERIYQKLGFTTHGHLESFSLPMD